MLRDSASIRRFSARWLRFITGCKDVLQMRMLVCIKQVPDTTEVKLGADYTLERDFVAQVMNPADESALELALQLQDKHGAR